MHVKFIRVNDQSLCIIIHAGVCVYVEPVITEGQAEIHILEDGWTAVSVDDSRSAQFEHTIIITQHGVEILTL